MFLNQKSGHQTVRNSYCNAVEYRSASSSHIDRYIALISQYIRSIALFRLRACLKISRGAVIGQKAGWRGATRETALRVSARLRFGKPICRTWEAHTLYGSSTEEQRSQTAFCAKTLRAADLLPWGFVVACVTARCGDAPPAPPRPKPKSPAAASLAIFRPALRSSDQ